MRDAYRTLEETFRMIPVDLLPLIPGFVERKEKDLEQLAILVAHGEFEAIRNIGHRLKGSGAGYGFQALSEIGASLEAAGRAHERAKITALIDALREEIAKIRACL